jgi:parallel beta-helix repeat protein
MRGRPAAAGGAAVVAHEQIPPVDPPDPPAQPDRGAVTLGTHTETILAGAIYVSPSGNNSNAGTIGSPKLTIGGARSVVASGKQIVLRAGVYNETVTESTKEIHIVNYPGEVVWLDGSRVETSWTSSGGRWFAANTIEFANGASFSQNTHQAEFMDDDYPMSRYPDRVYIDGVSQTQVATLAECGAGECFFDYAADRVYIGTNPAGHEVRIGNKTNAVNFSFAGCTIKGVGIRRYSNNISSFGALIMARTGNIAENVIVDDCATIGISVGMSNASAKNQIIRNCTITNCGLLGVHGNVCDGLVFENNVVSGNNAEHFNVAPSSAGIKVTHARGIRISNNLVTDNLAFAIWLDESVYDFAIVNNTVTGNVKAGIDVELCGNGIIAGNYVDCELQGETAIHLFDAGNIKVFNNLLAGGTLHDFQIKLDVRGAQGAATGATVSSQNDKRYADWATYSTAWRWSGIEFANNVMAVNGTVAQNPRSLWIEDITDTLDPDNYDIRIHHNYLPQRGAVGGTALMLYYNPSQQTWHNVSSINGFRANWSDNVQAAGADNPATMLAAAQDSWAYPIPSAASIRADFDSTGEVSLTTTGSTANVDTLSLFDMAAHLQVPVGTQVMGPP